MVSNYYDPLAEEDSVSERALYEHPEVVAPHVHIGHRDAEAPRVRFARKIIIPEWFKEAIVDYLRAPSAWESSTQRVLCDPVFCTEATFVDSFEFETPMANKSLNLRRTINGCVKALGSPDSIGQLVCSFLLECERGSFGVGSDNLLAKYMKAGISTPIALSALAEHNEKHRQAYAGEVTKVLPSRDHALHYDVHKAVLGSWWDHRHSAVYMCVFHPTQRVLDKLRCVGNVRWVQDAIKGGSFNPYGNGQPQGRPYDDVFLGVDDNLNSRAVRGGVHESDDEVIDRVIALGERDRVSNLLNSHGFRPVVNVDQTLSAIRTITPIATLFYQLYNATSKVDALVAAWAYLERMAVEDNYTTVKVGLGWATSYITRYRSVIACHLERSYEFLHDRAKSLATQGVSISSQLRGVSLQSEDGVNSMIDFLTQLTVGAQTNIRAQSFVWLMSFLFTSIAAAKSGMFVSFDTYSKKSKALVDRCFALGSQGVTISLFVVAIRHCYEMVRDLFTEGVGSLWKTEIAVVTELDARGKRLLSRGLLIDTSTDFNEIVTYGVDLEQYLKDVESQAPALATRQLGINLMGVGLSSETNAAILWSSVKKVSADLKVAMQRYKLMLASISYKKSPFTMAAVGGSSLGKSLFTQAVSAYINTLLGVTHDPRLIFTFNPGTDYMDGYKPYQTVVVLDDVATMRPDYCKEGDPQTSQIINMVNNVPYLTPQADLPDKKTHPFMSRAVILTSNTKDFNANVYATNPAAVLRRVKYRVTLRVHPDFVNAMGGLDQAKASSWSKAQPVGSASFPPFWIYKVEELVAANRGEDAITFKMEVQSNTLLDNGSTHQFLVWFRKAWLDHENNQAAAVDQVRELSNMKLCTHCSLPHPYHIRGCAGVTAGAIFQCSDVATCFDMVVDDWRFWAIITLFCTGVVARLYWVVKKFVDGIVIARDKSIMTMAIMEDASERLSHMAVTWSSIGLPMASVIGLFGIFYNSLMLAFGSGLYALMALFPLVRVRAIVQVKNTMLTASIMIAGGLMLRQLLKGSNKNSSGQRSVREQSRDESFERSTVDFSANDVASKWGDGVCKPYSGEHMAVAYSPGTKTSRGDSQDGVISSIQRAIFVCRIHSEDRFHSYSTVGNGFIYSQNPPVIGLNMHSLAQHRGRGDITITMMFNPNTSGTAVDSPELRPSDTFRFVTTDDAIHCDEAHDLAMIYVPGFARRGIARFFVLEPHKNGGVGPMLMGRNQYGNVVQRTLSGYKVEKSVSAAKGASVTMLPTAYSYTTENPTVNGESGSLLLLHLGESGYGEKGGVAVAGFHVGYVGASGRVVVAPLNKEVCDRLVYKIEMHRSATYNSQVGEVSNVVMQSRSDSTPIGSDNHVFDLGKVSPYGLVVPHRKAAINWVEASGSVQVFGGLAADCRLTQGLTSHYRLTRWSSALSSMSHSVLGCTRNDYLPTVVPTGELWKVHHRTLRDLLNDDTATIPDSILNNAVAGYIEDVIQSVRLSGNDSKWANFGVITTEQAINGIPGVLDSIVWKTGGGFGYSGPKRTHRVQVGVDQVTGAPVYTMDVDTMASISDADSLLRQGIDPGFVYQSHIKDEIRASKKVLNAELRMICGAPIPAIVLTRKYLASLIVFMAQNPLATECAVGVNSESRQWGDLARYLQEYAGKTRYVAGDYKNFDKNQTLQMTHAVGQVMLAMVLHANELYPGKYDAGDVIAIKTLLSGLCYPRYDHFGTLFAICGSNPSGNSLTAQRNCIANSLYTRSAFLWLAKSCVGLSEHLARKVFSRVVRQINYGDDVVLAIREHFSWYNHDTIAYALGLWGVPFTHADKSTSVGRPYEAFDQVTFLKRSFVYNAEIGDYLAPLDLSSITKSLHYYQPNNSISYSAAHSELLRAAAENVLSHGRDVYDKFCAEARGLASAAGLTGVDYQEATNFITWDSFLERWRLNSTNPKFGRFYTQAPPEPYNLIPMDDSLAKLVV